MSNINTTYALFEVQDYKNESTLSSYNLDITPLTFKADIPSTDFFYDLNRTEALFDFGDGTTGTGLTATHTYTLPGTYKVRMVLSDCENNSLLASYSTDIEIYDYIENTFTVEIEDDILPLSAGEFSKPITITNKAPFYQNSNNIFYTVSGFTIPNYFDLTPYKFNHLKKYYSFFEKSYIDNLSAFEYNEIPFIGVSGSNVYVRLSGNTIIDAKSTDVGSVFVGTSGRESYYFLTDQNTSERIVIDLFKDRNKIFSKDSSLNYSLNDYNNNLSISLTANVGTTSLSANLSSLSINDNGLTEEGDDEAQIFNISPVQFKKAPIPFFIKPTSISNYTVKEVTLNGSITGRLYDSNNEEVDSSYYSISNLNSSISGVDTDYWFYGNLTYDDGLSGFDTFSLRVSAEFTNTSETFQLTGESVNFSIYPKDYYYFAKTNEDVDYTEVFKSLRFQEILLDKNILFDDFIGSIFGNISSNNSSLGKTLNEKIFNFVDNKANIDTCDLNSLINISDLLDETANVYDESLFNFPPEIIRLMSLFSTDYNQFKGTKNKFKENFNDKGIATKDVYGKNLGSEIDIYSYTVTAGRDIVALEKFSNNYSLLNTYQPICAVDTLQYKLSEFNNDWGWPLVLPASFASADLSKFYTFYEYTSGFEGTVYDGLINYSDILNTFNITTELSSFKGDNNIEDIAIRNSLFSSLSII
tara:strand:+ start:1839 stop:3932 length:2094 start_codon:yes stop_codon:yes gene_type:complete